MTAPGGVPYLPPEVLPEGHVSETAKEMVDSGVTPYIPDVAAMMATIQALQERVKAVEAERGIPSDPVAAGVSDLTAHVKARAAMYPNHDFSSVLDILNNLPEVIDLKTSELLKTLVDDLVAEFHNLEVDYLPKLARSLHIAVAKRG